MCSETTVILYLLVVLVGTLYMLLKLNPTAVDTRIDDGVGEGITGGHCDCVVGMDLGTDYSSVSAYINGSLVRIPNEYGNLKTPSYVYFNDNREPVVGDEAKAQLTTKPNNVVFHAMRFLGRKFKDSFIKRQKKFYPFNIIPGPQKGVRLSLRVGGEGEFFTPEEIVALIIRKLKVDAENFLKTSVDCAVLSVPAMFLQAQRHAVKDAAMIAGIRAQRIHNTPTVSAAGFVSTGSEKLSRLEDKEVLVYYLGAGTCEVSLATLTSDSVEVESTNGTRDTGAVDLVHRVMHRYMSHRGDDGPLDKSPLLVQRLRREVERAVLEFSIKGAQSVNISVETPNGRVILREELTLRKFMELCEEVLDSTWKHIRTMVTLAKADNIKVKDILLLGGGVRIIGVPEAIQKYFPGLNVVQGEATPGEAKALGAAAYAAVLTGHRKSPILLDVSSYAIGLTGKEANITVFRQFHPLLVQTVKRYGASVDHQDTARTTFYEGDVPGENLLMFELNMRGGSKRRMKGDDILEVNYQLSADGFLEVFAKELFGNRKSIISLDPKNVLQGEDIAHLLTRWNTWLMPKGRDYYRKKVANDIYSRCLYSSLYMFSTGLAGEGSDRMWTYLRAEKRWYLRSGDLEAVNFEDRRRHLLSILKKSLDDSSIGKWKTFCDLCDV